MNRLLGALLITALLVSVNGAARAESMDKVPCPGMDRGDFERSVASARRSLILAPAPAAALLKLWRERSRHSSTIEPDRVVVFDMATKPFVIAIETEACVVTVMPMARQRLFRLLDRRLGRLV
ncbi:MAG: hypothetical protein ACFB6S_06565 [Geminicoccaceae bacterium]